ncbi:MULTISPECIES: hypothetical protein [unclassified Streptomyces]|uniref:hypothetical protein n=1 Tax=unclassified Streptomyces TaxID=2593676 RepID=UPI0011C8C4F0|nr:MULTISPECIES: hypothetical protein [unclassified Streptomyces]TXL92493.1 hypothetical protein EW053_03545 [Streptomyces sp. IB2014 016-6]
MRRTRPGAGSLGSGGGTLHARRAAGEERTLTSVEAGPDFDDFDDVQDPGPSRRTQARGEDRAVSKLWHITLSVSGSQAPLTEVRRGLEQLAHDHPFLLTSRYANDHAEIRYWEEARDLHDAAAVALRLWGEHRSSARLPPWEIVGLEVIDRETYHLRIAEGYGPPPAAPVGVHPF